MQKGLRLWACPATNQHPCEPLVQQWMYSLLIECNAVSEIDSSMKSELILKTLGLKELDADELDPAYIKKRLIKQRRVFFKETTFDIKEQTIMRNIRQLASVIDLNTTEIELLLFIVLLKSHNGLTATSELMEELTITGIQDVLSITLGHKREDIILALSPSGVLRKTGLIEMSNFATTSINESIEPFEGLINQLMLPQKNCLDLVKQYLSPGIQTSLSEDDFPYINRELRIIKDYLASHQQHQSKGVNILIYGRPGTGKTEFASVIAEITGMRLYTIASSNEASEPINSAVRFKAYQLGHEILKRQNNSLILFDEIEDVFPGEASDLFSGKKHIGKAWINRMLETSHVPTVWISNNIAMMDKAYIRRFDVVVKMKTPPRSIRKNILNRHFKEMGISKQWIDNASLNEDLAPGIISRTAKVIKAITNKSSTALEADLEQLMNNTLTAMDYPKLNIPENRTFHYDTTVINADHDLGQLLIALRSHLQARICLYGPSGTGKTAFGKHIAEKLDKPLLVKRASDLLGHYVGENEQNLAAMFDEAKQDDGVLLLDEADSFLQDRQSARQQWQVSQVNELLTQMELFNGIFICTTNMVEKLDSASLRRFDLKIKMDYLQPEQAWKMFCMTIESTGNRLTQPNKWKAKLAGMRQLTPGDFSTVVRRNKLSVDPLNPQSLYGDLISEVSLKQGNNKRGIGFTSGF